MAQLTITIEDAALTAFVNAQCELTPEAFAASGLSRPAFAKKVLLQYMADRVISARKISDAAARADLKTDWLSKAT